jgi:cytochrome P450
MTDEKRTMTETQTHHGGRDHFQVFDLDSPEFADNYEGVLSWLAAMCPVARSNVTGGYWLVSRYDDVRQCAQGWQTFSREGGFERGRGSDCGAKLYPVELRSAVQTRWRNVLGPYFGSGAIRSREASIREHADILLDGFIENGHCDFVDESFNVDAGTTFEVPETLSRSARIGADACPEQALRIIP